jgi:putative tryptophan/tyrosine transport system substrate-binding protein
VIGRRRAAVCAAAWLAGAAAAPAHGQPAPRRIVFLTVFPRANSEPFLGLVRDELHKLGWIDGRNLTLALRTTEGRNDLLPAVAAELVAQAPDLLLVQTIPAARALKQVTQTIPVVMISVGNPVEYGLVAELRRPGGNLTGSVYPAEEANRKLLHLLKEAAPRLRSVALFANPSNDATAPIMRLLRADAAALGLQTQVVEVLTKADFDAAFATIRGAGTQSILLPAEPLIVSQRDAIAEFAQVQRVPVAAVGAPPAVADGTLIAFAPSRREFTQIAARQVDRILKGAAPADMPVEQPTRFELRINQRTARALGLTLPQSLLLRADEVVE